MHCDNEMGVGIYGTYNVRQVSQVRSYKYTRVYPFSSLLPVRDLIALFSVLKNPINWFPGNSQERPITSVLRVRRRREYSRTSRPFPCRSRQRRPLHDERRFEHSGWHNLRGLYRFLVTR